MSLANRLFSFNGRLRRQDWWVFGIAFEVLYGLASYSSAKLLFPHDPFAREPLWGDPAAPLAVNAALTALFVWPQLALTVKRAHDINLPGWPFALASVAGTLLSFFSDDQLSMALHLPTDQVRIGVWVIVGLLFLLFIPVAFIDGKPAPNRFGISPKYGANQRREPAPAAQDA